MENPTPSRRGLLAGLVASLVAVFAFPFQAWADAAKRREMLHKMSKLQFIMGGPIKNQDAVAYSESTPVKDEDLVLIVMGGTLPNQKHTSLRPVYGGVDDDAPQYLPPNQKATLVFEQAIPQVPGCYPHSPRFQMLADVMIGTVDEIVEDFRRGLVRAKQDSDKSLKEKGVSREAIQENLRAVREKCAQRVADFGGDDPRILFDHDNQCAAAAKARREFDSYKTFQQDVDQIIIRMLTTDWNGRREIFKAVEARDKAMAAQVHTRLHDLHDAAHFTG